MKIDEDMKMKAVLFDVYGTLISTGTGSINAVKSILAKKHSKLNLKHSMLNGSNCTKKGCAKLSF